MDGPEMLGLSTRLPLLKNVVLGAAGIKTSMCNIHYYPWLDLRDLCPRVFIPHKIPPLAFQQGTLKWRLF
ncbi:MULTISPECIES: hypothetical protein [unclassified Methylobacter]|uniref:hypothetical protein n=1 Tax=unclassified Methylobacter TaxID=2635283 RepID=UPI001894B40B|nr:hypothetical protein [Methylobacter sp. BlB1]MBF6647567.1 hypothetical protein [Methylobacter sp. BlB1]